MNNDRARSGMDNPNQGSSHFQQFMDFIVNVISAIAGRNDLYRQIRRKLKQLKRQWLQRFGLADKGDVQAAHRGPASRIAPHNKASIPSGHSTEIILIDIAGNFRA